jgi:hypothetical protein
MSQHRVAEGIVIALRSVPAVKMRDVIEDASGSSGGTVPAGCKQGSSQYQPYVFLLIQEFTAEAAGCAAGLFTV